MCLATNIAVKFEVRSIYTNKPFHNLHRRKKTIERLHPKTHLVFSLVFRASIKVEVRLCQSEFLPSLSSFT